MVVGVIRRALLVLVLALLVSASEALPQPSVSAIPSPSVVAGLPAAHRVGGAYRNLDPEYHRAPLWARARSLIVGGTWLVGERSWWPSSAEEGRKATLVTSVYTTEQLLGLKKKT